MILLGSTPGQDIPLSMERIESNRNFANKLWNAGKYLQNVLSTLSKADTDALAVDGSMTSSELASLPLAEKYIVSTCHNLIAEVFIIVTITNTIITIIIITIIIAAIVIIIIIIIIIIKVTNDLETYNFGEAGRRIYEFLWDEYADWYIEISKIRYCHHHHRRHHHHHYYYYYHYHHYKNA